MAWPGGEGCLSSPHFRGLDMDMVFLGALAAASTGLPAVVAERAR